MERALFFCLAAREVKACELQGCIGERAAWHVECRLSLRETACFCTRVQEYLARKKTPPPPMTHLGPWA